MNIHIVKEYQLLALVVAGLFITGYLFWGTGLHGDDLVVISQMRGFDFRSFLGMEGNDWLLMGPVGYYLFWWTYPLANTDSVWIYDFIKWLSCILSILFVYRSLIDYLPRDRAFLAAMLFVFNPVHETTLYWYMTAIYVLSPALIMLAHSLIRKEEYSKGFWLGCLGAFMGYVSPPYSIGLAVIFIIEKSYKKAVIFLLPGMIYVAYYFTILVIHPSAEHRLDHSLAIPSFIKNYAVQIAALFDSMVGPSFWLKIYFAIGSMGIASLFLSLIVIIFLINNLKTQHCRLSSSLLWGLIAVLLFSFWIFSMADIVGHKAFNLGNRLSVYGSLLIAFLIASIPLSKKFLAMLVICFVLPTFGLSDHWKSWNISQNIVINNIKNNQDLKKLAITDALLVTGNMYSKLGPFDHIEFLNMPWNVEAIFRGSTKCKEIMPLNNYVYFDGQRLIDSKLNTSVAITKDLYLYNSDKDAVSRILPQDLPDILAKRPRELRHWVQMLKGTWVESCIVYLSPRLANVF